MKHTFVRTAVIAAILSTTGALAQAAPQTDIPLPYSITLTSLNQSLAICLDRTKLDLLHQVLHSESWYNYHRNAVIQIDWMLGDGHLNYETTKVSAWANADETPGSVQYIVRQTNHPNKCGLPVATFFLEVNQGELISMVRIPSITFEHSSVPAVSDRLGRYDSDKIALSNIVLHLPEGATDEVAIQNRNRPTELKFKMKDYVQCLQEETRERSIH